MHFKTDNYLLLLSWQIIIRKKTTFQHMLYVSVLRLNAHAKLVINPVFGDFLVFLQNLLKTKIYIWQTPTTGFLPVEPLAWKSVVLLEVNGISSRYILFEVFQNAFYTCSGWKISHGLNIFWPILNC